MATPTPAPPATKCPGTQPAGIRTNALHEALLQQNLKDNQDDMDGSDSGMGWIIFIIVLFVILAGLSIWLYFKYFSSQRDRISQEEDKDISYCDSLTGKAKSDCIDNAMKGARESRNITNVAEGVGILASVWPTKN